MINILPSGLKKEIRFSRYNVLVLKYIMYIGLIAFVTGGALITSHWYADRQIADYQQTLQQKTEAATQYQQLETSIKKLNERTRTVKALLEQRPRFSVLLEDIAEVLPQGSYLNGISLTEEINQPVELTITTPSRDQALQLQNALLQSPRINSADIQSIGQKTGNDTVNVSIVIAFTSGEES